MIGRWVTITNQTFEYIFKHGQVNNNDVVDDILNHADTYSSSELSFRTGRTFLRDVTHEAIRGF